MNALAELFDHPYTTYLYTECTYKGWTWSADWMPHIRRSRYENVRIYEFYGWFMIDRNLDWILILFRASWWSCRRLWNLRSLLLLWSMSQTGSTFFGRQSLIVFIIQWIDSHFLVFVETNLFQGAEAWNLGQAVPGVGGALQVGPRKGSCCVKRLRLVSFVGTSHMWLTEAGEHYLNIWN